jgi:hypothetical protein
MAEGTDLIHPVPPGEILREDFMEPLGLSANALAKALRATESSFACVVPTVKSRRIKSSASKPARLAGRSEISLGLMSLKGCANMRWKTMPSSFSSRPLCRTQALLAF